MSHEIGISKIIPVGYYFVAFIDVVGQRDKLKQWTGLPKNSSENENIARTLLETSEYIKALRKQFNDYFEAASKPTGLLDQLNTQQRMWAELRNKHILWQHGFSDSYFIIVPCYYDWHDKYLWGSHINTIYACLFSICGLFIWSLANKKPFRGAVEIGLGTEMGKEEVYGPVNVRVLELEKSAGYPRIIVGEGLQNHIKKLENNCPHNFVGKDTNSAIQNCRKLIIRDTTGKYMLDPFSDDIRSTLTKSGSETLNVILDMIKAAYKFVLEQQQSYINLDNKLYTYYTDLRKYIESKLHIWDINLIN